MLVNKCFLNRVAQQTRNMHNFQTVHPRKTSRLQKMFLFVCPKYLYRVFIWKQSITKCGPFGNFTCSITFRILSTYNTRNFTEEILPLILIYRSNSEKKNLKRTRTTCMYQVYLRTSSTKINKWKVTRYQAYE